MYHMADRTLVIKLGTVTIWITICDFYTSQTLYVRAQNIAEFSSWSPYAQRQFSKPRYTQVGLDISTHPREAHETTKNDILFKATRTPYEQIQFLSNAKRTKLRKETSCITYSQAQINAKSAKRRSKQAKHSQLHFQCWLHRTLKTARNNNLVHNVEQTLPIFEISGLISANQAKPEIRGLCHSPAKFVQSNIFHSISFDFEGDWKPVRINGVCGTGLIALLVYCIRSGRSDLCQSVASILFVCPFCLALLVAHYSSAYSGSDFGRIPFLSKVRFLSELLPYTGPCTRERDDVLRSVLRRTRKQSFFLERVQIKRDRDVAIRIKEALHPLKYARLWQNKFELSGSLN